MIIGIAMGLVLIFLIYSNWGKQSGAHMNPAFTLCFLRLGKMALWDAVFYMIAQFTGGILGVAAFGALAEAHFSHASVNHVVTVPGSCGVFTAWIAEFAISLIFMASILGLNRFPRLVKRTGLVAGGLLALYITFEAPISGASFNPARTLSSAVPANVFTGLWIYFTAPVAGMLTAVEVYRLPVRQPHRLCCKLTHSEKTPSVVQCDCLTGAK